MSRVCSLSGKRAMTGHKVSHANNKTNRKFEINLQKVSFLSDILKTSIQIRMVSTIETTIDVADGVWINLTADKSPYFDWRETAGWTWDATFETDEDVEKRLDKEADAFVKDFREAHPEVSVSDDIIKLIFKEARTVEEDEYEDDEEDDDDYEED